MDHLPCQNIDDVYCNADIASHERAEAKLGNECVIAFGHVNNVLAFDSSKQ